MFLKLFTKILDRFRVHGRRNLTLTIHEIYIELENCFYYSINMEYSKLLVKLNNNVRSQFRLLERLKKRLIIVRWSKYFYEIFQKKKLMPKHI